MRLVSVLPPIIAGFAVFASNFRAEQDRQSEGEVSNGATALAMAMLAVSGAGTGASKTQPRPHPATTGMHPGVTLASQLRQ